MFYAVATVDGKPQALAMSDLERPCHDLGRDRINQMPADGRPEDMRLVEAESEDEALEKFSD
jgi:hypothetical protein